MSQMGEHAPDPLARIAVRSMQWQSMALNRGRGRGLIPVASDIAT